MKPQEKNSYMDLPDKFINSYPNSKANNIAESDVLVSLSHRNSPMVSPELANKLVSKKTFNNVSRDSIKV